MQVVCGLWAIRLCVGQQNPWVLPTVVRWLGKSGARLRDLPLLLNQMDGPPPAMIHLGTNDLVSSDQFCIRQLIASI